MEHNSREVVSGPADELDALRAEMRKQRRELARRTAAKRIKAGPGPGEGPLILSRNRLLEVWRRALRALAPNREH